MTGGGGGGEGTGRRSLRTHLLDTSGKKKMYSAKNKFLQATVKRRIETGKQSGGGWGVVWREWGQSDEREGGLGGIYGKEGEAAKTLNIYFCLCVSKEILAIIGVFFLPGMKQK